METGSLTIYEVAMAQLTDEKHVHEPKYDPRCARCLALLRASIKKGQSTSSPMGGTQDETLSKQW